MVWARGGARRSRADLRVRARLHLRPRGLAPGFRDRGGMLRARLRARRAAAVLRGLGHSSRKRPLTARRRAVRRVPGRPDARDWSDLGTLPVAARGRRRDPAPASLREIGLAGGNKTRMERNMEGRAPTIIDLNAE